jgi:hypothetical protein
VLYAAMDIDLHRAASLADRYGLAYYTPDASEVAPTPGSIQFSTRQITPAVGE